MIKLADARRMIAAAEKKAEEIKQPMNIAIVDEGGHPILLERLDNTFPAGANISIGKARTAALFKKPVNPTKLRGVLLASRQKARAAKIAGVSPAVASAPATPLSSNSNTRG